MFFNPLNKKGQLLYGSDIIFSVQDRKKVKLAQISTLDE